MDVASKVDRLIEADVDLVIEYQHDSDLAGVIGCVTFHPEQYGERLAKLVFSMLRGLPVDPNNYTEHHWVGRAADSVHGSCTGRGTR